MRPKDLERIQNKIYLTFEISLYDEMKEIEIARIYEKEAKKSQKKSIYKNVVDEIWGNAIVYFLRYLDYKSYNKILKLDLWDETVANFLSIRKSILKYLNPRQLLYLEISKEFCRKHKNKFNSSNEWLINGNIIRMPFKQNSLDAIIDVSTSDHVGEEFTIVIKEFRKILKKDGYLILFHINNEYFNTEKFKENYNFPIYARNGSEIERILEKEGFQIIRKRYFFNMFFDSSFVSLTLHLKLLSIISKFFGKLSYTIFNFSPITRYSRQNWMIGYLARK